MTDQLKNTFNKLYVQKGQRCRAFYSWLWLCFIEIIGEETLENSHIYFEIVGKLTVYLTNVIYLPILSRWDCFDEKGLPIINLVMLLATRARVQNRICACTEPNR